MSSVKILLAQHRYPGNKPAGVKLIQLPVCVCVCASLNTLCLTWLVCFVETEQLCFSVDTTSVVFPYHHHQNQMTERTVQSICRCDAFVSISVFLPPTLSWKAFLPPLHHFLIQTYLLL